MPTVYQLLYAAQRVCDDLIKTQVFKQELLLLLDLLECSTEFIELAVQRLHVLIDLYFEVHFVGIETVLEVTALAEDEVLLDVGVGELLLRLREGEEAFFVLLLDFIDVEE